MNEFVSISALMQSRKYKIDSKDITERFQFIWLINYDTNSRKNVYSKVILFLIASDWCSPIIVTKPNAFCI